jgi:hypothetical protein
MRVVDTEALFDMIARIPMNSNGPVQIDSNSTSPVLLSAICHFAAIKSLPMRALVHLNIWLNRGQREEE